MNFRPEFTGAYSKDEHQRAHKSDISPDLKAKLEEYRAIRDRWVKANQSGEPGLIGAAVKAFKIFRESIRPDQMEYRHKGFPGRKTGHAKHLGIEKQYAKTEAGQLELAQQEASFFNDAFDVRAERLSQATKGKERGGSRYDFEKARAEFDVLVKDLNEGDLNKYMANVTTLKIAEDNFGPGSAKRNVRSDTQGSDVEEQFMKNREMDAEAKRIADILIDRFGVQNDEADFSDLWNENTPSKKIKTAILEHLLEIKSKEVVRRLAYYDDLTKFISEERLDEQGIL